MGLDLTVRKTSAMKTNEKGQTTWVTTELYNFRGCYDLMERLGALYGYFENCSTLTFSDSELFSIYEDMKKEIEIYRKKKVSKLPNEDNDSFEERVRNRLNVLEHELGELECFFEEEHINKETLDSNVYEIHAWW